MAKPKSRTATTVLVLQGGGALGSYQAGVYEALAECGEIPCWVAGISIGAINAAIIAGNPPERRIERLRAFWDLASSRVTIPSLTRDGEVRRWFNEMSAGIVAMTGIPGFFEPRLIPPGMLWPDIPQAISFYDTAPLRQTLLDLVDFDLLNAKKGVRFSVGAVNVLTGNFVYFDNREREIIPEHIMASGALPPGFPPVFIEGEPYWDGGLVSNTPLQYVLDTSPNGGLTIFQVDLFSARGRMPLTLPDALQREKDIRYSSRTRLNTDLNKQMERLRDAARRLVEKLPDELRDDADARMLAELPTHGGVSIMHLINRSEMNESHSKDYEFSRYTIDEHWATGHKDAHRSLHDDRWKGRDVHASGIATFDLTSDL
ncbi:patatin-like phospholipase family protein [Croceicoccus ponticola]|uniref:Patatin-like phospholipase family protein n=1 Tax=Croceicoccus ponticola TaxID=2217664 RepID=A0A437GWY8_9SPHN|nr:patatin-like phospholipase family protein [Croceicoccus ponticola]RVQ66441.1 patatin-like phospholipase family protein [Croceicoccus ponticola]